MAHHGRYARRRSPEPAVNGVRPITGRDRRRVKKRFRKRAGFGRSAFADAIELLWLFDLATSPSHRR